MKLDEYIEGLCANSSAILAKSLQSWRAGIDSEIGFWSRWFETRGLEWPEDYRVRTSPQPLAPWLANMLPPANSEPVHVLDVGAGPITKTGHFIVGRDIVFTAIDPLANFYNEIIDSSGVVPPLRTQHGFAEDLSARFDVGQFDLVSCTNALDHAIEPAWGIVEMMQVVKLNGTIFLGHRRNEAEFESYSGFHQWNFDVDDGAFVIWNRNGRLNISELLGGVGDVSCHLQGDYLSVTIRKQSDLVLDHLRFHRRLRAGLLEAMLMAR